MQANAPIGKGIYHFPPKKKLPVRVRFGVLYKEKSNDYEQRRVCGRLAADRFQEMTKTGKEKYAEVDTAHHGGKVFT